MSSEFVIDDPSQQEDVDLPPNPSNPLTESSTGNENEGPDSSFSNIIPPQVQKGWGIFKTWMNQTAEVVKETAIEIGNSELVQDIKLKTTEAANATYTAASPIWDKTVEVVTIAADKTVETSVAIADQVTPVMNEVITRILFCYEQNLNMISNNNTLIFDHYFLGFHNSS
jgi:uncharacterized protein YciU (UPF0263 family)